MRGSLVVALLSAGLAATGVWWLTRAPGPGLSPDSMSYLSAAGALARGDGPRVPFAEWSDADSTSRLRDFPPGFPAFIAAGIRLGLAPAQSARGVMMLAAAGSVFGTALLVGAASGPMAGALAAVTVAAAPAFVEEHYVVLSEPLFLAVMVGLLALMAARRPRPLALGLLSGVGVMVRYAGVSLPFGAALWSLRAPGTRRERLGRAALAAAPGAAAFVLWSRWAGGVRKYGWKGHLWPTLAEGWATLQSWLAPALAPSPWRMVLALGALAVLVWLLVGGLARADASAPAPRLVTACGTLAGAYAAIVLVSRLTADGEIPFDDRLLAPAFLLVTVAVVTLGVPRWRAMSRLPRAAAAVAVAAWLTGSLLVVGREAGELADDGWGYASADWTGSDLAVWLEGEGRDYAFFTDNPPSIYSLTGRPSRRLDDTEPGDDAAVAEVLSRGRAAIVGFTDTDTGERGRTAALARRLGWREVVRSDEGVVWVK